MRIDASSPHATATPREKWGASTWGRPQQTPFLATLLDAARTNAKAEASPATEAGPINFRQATRQELFDWMNSQIRAGQMSLDQSSPFLGMTLKISAATGHPVDMATDSERIDLFEKTRLGIEGALSRFDFDQADRLRAALERMERLDSGTSDLADDLAPPLQIVPHHIPVEIVTGREEHPPRG